MASCVVVSLTMIRMFIIRSAHTVCVGVQSLGPMILIAGIYMEEPRSISMKSVPLLFEDDCHDFEAGRTLSIPSTTTDGGLPLTGDVV